MFNNQPLFSIITICYNSAETIERTLKSVLSQTYTDYEYIIVDGGSKDSTLDIIRKYEPLFEGRMKWKSEPDRGIYNAMNKGVNRSTGQIIGIVNSDDWLEPKALADVYNVSKGIENYKDAIFCGSINFHYENGDYQSLYSNKERFYAGIPNHSYNYGAYHPAIFVGYNVYETIGCFDENFRIEADTDFIYRCYKGNKRFIFIDNILSNMFDGGASNEIDFVKYYKEKKYFIYKNQIKGINAYYIMAKFLVRITLKKCLPYLILKKIRSLKK